MKRRFFIRTAGISAAGSVLLPGLVTSGCKSANDLINIGMIGVGSHGVDRNLKHYLKYPDLCRVVAVCDVSMSRAESAMNLVNNTYKNKDCRAYQDFRELLDDRSIDAVQVSTPDHWHVPVSIMAALKGKHICCEKPTLTIDEGRLLCNVIKDKNVIYQLSMEDRFLPVYHRMAEITLNGRIGKLSKITISLPVPPMPDKGLEITDPPEDLDYDMWLGPAAEIPYIYARTFYNFRWYDAFSGGLLTDWGAHYCDTAQLVTGSDLSGPVEVEPAGETLYYNDGIFNTAWQFDLRYRYSDDVIMQVRSGNASIRLEGDEGWIESDGWNVSYTGVNNAGTPVSIQFDWDDGAIDVVPATAGAPGFFQTTVRHTYTSKGDKCNYRPRSSLIVNGVVCSSSTQEQIVTVWDDDDHNGGRMHISPEIYPICFGSSADVRFQDLTRFNCVPPQEKDVPNLYTRWIQWIYGTDITMTGSPVTINGSPASYPMRGPVITLLGPVSGSGIYSDIINVADDKLIGQYFEVTLRNWNYCNPYDDPDIPGPPADPLNGDNDPVVTTARILIVPYPDATISSVDALCTGESPVSLTAAEGGGRWSGNGVSGNRFSPEAAGPGDHIIRYSVTNQYGCSSSDSIIITVVPPPSAYIEPVGVKLVTDPPFTLSASPPGGTWSGTGLAGNLFNPMEAGTGMHVIKYVTPVDRFGCSGEDTIHIHVVPPALPVAEFLPDTSGCTPLPVRFRNKSTGGESYLWDFGDKTWSREKDPIHTYYIPGNYIVTLTVSNFTGESIFRTEIRVYQNPTAMFGVYPVDVINNSQVVRFTDYSVYAASWLWYFGDYSSSIEQNPWHKYESEGQYNVSLVVTSANGCTDSASYGTPVKVEYRTGSIRFPNAFRWNQSGPTGGYWRERELADDIFRPVFDNVTEYYLQIYNRWGVLIYESDDLYKGWDGYFGNGHLAVQGVYVWKVAGRFADGDYFERVGDVTFLH